MDGWTTWSRVAGWAGNFMLIYCTYLVRRDGSQKRRDCRSVRVVEVWCILCTLGKNVTVASVPSPLPADLVSICPAVRCGGPCKNLYATGRAHVMHACMRRGTVGNSRWSCMCVLARCEPHKCCSPSPERQHVCQPALQRSCVPAWIWLSPQTMYTRLSVVLYVCTYGRTSDMWDAAVRYR